MASTVSVINRLPVPALMGILNVTPDSFSDGGLFLEPRAAIAQARRLAADGAHLIDVGGESSRPGAEPVPVEQELRRVVPVVERIAGELDTPISIDTCKLPVAERAVAAGAAMVNDVSAFRLAPDLAAFCATGGVDVCLMHMQGLPQDMQVSPRYDDVVSEVKAFLDERLEFAVGEGIAEDRIAIDPGIGFGKTLEHNLELLRRLDEIVALGPPVVIGTSRKSFLGALTGKGTSERLPGTIASCVAALRRGARIFRVHDVSEVLDALTVAAAIDARPPHRADPHISGSSG